MGRPARRAGPDGPIPSRQPGHGRCRASEAVGLARSPRMGHPIPGEHPGDADRPTWTCRVPLQSGTKPGPQRSPEVTLTRGRSARRVRSSARCPAPVACDTGPVKLELTRRGAYAIRAALTLARTRQGAVVPASRIAREMDIPARFLPQVLGDLTRAGIVEARLGRSGGYRLARSPAEVSLLDIIQATEGDARRRTCVLSGRSCGDVEPACDVHEVFFAAQGALLGRLARATLDDILASAVVGVPLAAWATAPSRSQPSSWEPPASS